MKEPLRECYEQIPIPEELDARVDEAIRTGLRRRRRGPVRRAGTALAACAAFVLVLNLNPSFAAAVSQVPVLGDLCQVLTFQSYQAQGEHSIANVTVPQVEVEGDGTWAQAVNDTISQTIDRSVEESMARAEEYYDAYVATGGDPEEFHTMEISVDYTVTCSTGKLLSFSIEKYETLASAYYEHYYYNIDLTTGQELTLRDLLGEDYQDIVTRQVEAQLERMDQEDREMLFDWVDLSQLIGPDRGFYLKEDGTIVVTFEKYELGAGALGRLEFPLEEKAAL